MDPRPLIYYLCASYLAENDGRDDRALRARNHFAGGVRASDPRHPGVLHSVLIRRRHSITHTTPVFRSPTVINLLSTYPDHVHSPK